MLISISERRRETAEEVETDVFSVADLIDRDGSSIWLGQHLLLRGALRDGKQLELAMSLTECAAFYLRLRGDQNVRAWCDAMEARALSEPTAHAAQDH